MKFSIKKLFWIFLVAVGVFSLSLSLASSKAAYADPVRPLDSFCTEVGNTGDICELDQNDKTAGDNGLLAKDGIVKKVFDLLSWLTGLLAGIFIIVGGFRLITSGGNKDTVKSARNTVIYAAVGLAVIILANLIINVVIGLSNQANS